MTAGRLVFLCRHGAVATAGAKVYIGGGSDPSLNREGREQALSLGHALDGHPVTAAFCSDLARSRETVGLVLGNRRNVPIVVRHDLREVAMGEWEGLSHDEAESRFPEDFAARQRDLAGHSAKGGESFAECQARVVPAFEEIVASSSGDILIVAHGGVNRALLCALLGMPIANLFHLGQDHGCLNILQLDKSVYHIKLLNYVP